MRYDNSCISNIRSIVTIMSDSIENVGLLSDLNCLISSIYISKTYFMAFKVSVIGLGLAVERVTSDVSSFEKVSQLKIFVAI